MDIRVYTTRDRKTPFLDWLKKLRDQRARDRIHNQVDRLRLGNAGDYKSVGDGIFELRIHYGPGYRIYFGHADKQIIFCFALVTRNSNNRISSVQDNIGWITGDAKWKKVDHIRST